MHSVAITWASGRGLRVSVDLWGGAHIPRIHRCRWGRRTADHRHIDAKADYTDHLPPFCDAKHPLTVCVPARCLGSVARAETSGIRFHADGFLPESPYIIPIPPRSTSKRTLAPLWPREIEPRRWEVPYHGRLNWQHWRLNRQHWTHPPPSTGSSWERASAWGARSRTGTRRTRPGGGGARGCPSGPQGSSGPSTGWRTPRDTPFSAVSAPHARCW